MAAPDYLPTPMGSGRGRSLASGYPPTAAHPMRQRGVLKPAVAVTERTGDFFNEFCPMEPMPRITRFKDYFKDYTEAEAVIR
ncbi:hypothetical protein E2320_021904, partial [Naja naja]